MKTLFALTLLFTLALSSAGDAVAGKPIGEAAAGKPPTAAIESDAAQSCPQKAGTEAKGAPLAQGGGCCKGHKGVCGCRAGKIVCCDKSFDKNCRCNRDDPPPPTS